MMARRGRRSTIDGAGVRARAARAESFLELAVLGAELEPSSDRAASIANSINAGIAACDAICGHLLGEQAQGDDHAEAVSVLGEALGANAAAPIRDLGRLLAGKTPAQYGTKHFSVRESTEMLERARRLIHLMRTTLRS